MKKKILLFIVAFILLSQVFTQKSTASNVDTTYMKTNIKIYKDGARIILDTPVYSRKGKLYVPARKVLKALNVLDVSEMIHKNGKHELTGLQWESIHNWKSFLMEEGNSTIYVREGTYETGLPIPYINDTLMMPVSFIQDVLKEKTNYNKKAARIDISTGKTINSIRLQKNNRFQATVLERKSASDLDDNRMGNLVSDMYVFNKQQLDENLPLQPIEYGAKWWSITINNQDWITEETKLSEMEIDPKIDKLYTKISNMGVGITYNLIFKDRDFVNNGGVLGVPRFKTEDEIQRYLDFVKFTVRHFKGRVKVYEIWNEQNIQGTPQYIEPEDYIKLVKRTIPVIRKEDPQAKISVGQTTGYADKSSREYTNEIVQSDIMPLVDVVAIHGLFWDSPEYNAEYYYSYPELLEELKGTARKNGFTGEFVASEGNYSAFDHIPSDMVGRVPEYSYLTATKYMARGNIINLAKDFAGGTFGINNNVNPGYITYGNLCTLMAGAKPKDMDVIISSKEEYISEYSFALPNKDKYIVVWNNIAAKDNDKGSLADIKIKGYTNYKVTAIDSINFFEQKILTEVEDDYTVIKDFIIKDYPIFIKLSKR